MRNLMFALCALVVGCGSSVEDVAPPPAPPECKEAAECDDGDPCTVERCGLGECIFYPEGHCS